VNFKFCSFLINVNSAFELRPAHRVKGTRTTFWLENRSYTCKATGRSNSNISPRPLSCTDCNTSQSGNKCHTEKKNLNYYYSWLNLLHSVFCARQVSRIRLASAKQSAAEGDQGDDDGGSAESATRVDQGF
jgi:hypothetical protein